MWASLIAVFGTLAGALVSAGIQQRGARAERMEQRAEILRSDRLDAVTDLAAVVSAHRRAMYMRGEARLRGESADRVEELRSESHQTRAAVTAPLVRVRLLVPDPVVRAAADAMVDATYGMRRADGTTDTVLTREGLTEARRRAAEAHDTFVEAAAAYLA